MQRKPHVYRSADPMIWGAVLGIIAAVIVGLSDYFGTSRPDNLLLATPIKAGFAFFGFGMMVAMFRNWFNERRRGL